MREDYERAVALHKDMIYSFAYYYLGSAEEAEDVTQDVLIKLWQHLPGLPADSVSPWLNRVTRNASYDRLRKRRTLRRFVVEPFEDDDPAASAPTSEPDPEAAASRTSLRGRVRAAIADLPEPYRSVLILRELQELSYADTARTLEIPLNTAKVQVHRGRKLLRDKLRSLFEEGASAGRATC